jgi:hypothetical protein
VGFLREPHSKQVYVEGSNRIAYTCSVCGKKWINKIAKLECETWDSRPIPNASEPE